MQLEIRHLQKYTEICQASKLKIFGWNLNFKFLLTVKMHICALISHEMNKITGVVYFKHLSGTRGTQKLVEILILGSFLTFLLILDGFL